MSEVRDRLAALRARIQVLRPENPCRIMAVSKGQTRERIDEAKAAGIDLFGENRVQEAMAKWADAPRSTDLHLIGHLQSNKVKYAIQLFSAIDSIDSESIAEALNHRLSHEFSVMLEVNVGREPSKSGLNPDCVRLFLDRAERFNFLRFDGILAMLPQARDSSAEESQRIRRLMQETSELWRSCQSDQWPWAPLWELSMGMTNDYEWALEAGATMIRIGQGIFGPRG